MEENNNKPIGFIQIDRPYADRSVPDRVSLYGKIKAIWRVARSSKKFAYGVYRSENRAASSLGGPLSFGNPNGCSSRPHFTKKMLKTLDKPENVLETLVCGTLKKKETPTGVSFQIILLTGGWKTIVRAMTTGIIFSFFLPVVSAVAISTTQMFSHWFLPRFPCSLRSAVLAFHTCRTWFRQYQFSSS